MCMFLPRSHLCHNHSWLCCREQLKPRYLLISASWKQAGMSPRPVSNPVTASALLQGLLQP